MKLKEFKPKHTNIIIYLVNKECTEISKINTIYRMIKLIPNVYLECEILGYKDKGLQTLVFINEL